MAKDESWDWAKAVPLLHPVKVAIIEAMLCVEEPMSAVDIDQMCEGPPGVSTIAYHLRNLAFDFSILALYREELVGSAWKRLYFFRHRTPASEGKASAA